MLLFRSALPYSPRSDLLVCVLACTVHTAQVDLLVMMMVRRSEVDKLSQNNTCKFTREMMLI